MDTVTASKTMKPATAKVKAVKVNPSASYIGLKISHDTSMSLNYRKGKNNVILCNQVEVTGANATGRRLTCIFRDAAGKEIDTRRVYKEWFEKMAEQFGALLPE